MWKLGDRPALTGLRAVAVSLVLLTHFEVPRAGELGAMGVTMFFALSGFLITALLLDEASRSGRISVRDFYWRRAARLGPALLLCVGLAVVVEAIALGGIADWSLVVGALTWTTNFTMFDGHFPVSPLEHTWSLAVEEQFYLLWPLAVLVLVRIPRRWALIAVAYLAIGAVVVRHVVYDPTVYLGHAYLGLDARADQLLLGALLALALTGRAAPRVPAVLAPAAVAAVVLLGLSPARSLLMPTAVAALTCAALAACATTRVRMLETPVTQWVGERAYGLYLFHLPVHFAVQELLPDAAWWTTGIVALVASLVVAAGSYRLLEQPVRHRARVAIARNRLKGSAEPDAAQNST